MSEDQSTAFEPSTSCRCPRCIAHFARSAAAMRDCKTSPADGKAELDPRVELAAEKKARQQAEAQRDMAVSGREAAARGIAVRDGLISVLEGDNRRLEAERDTHARTVDAQLLTIRKLRQEIVGASQARLRMRALIGDALAV